MKLIIAISILALIVWVFMSAVESRRLSKCVNPPRTHYWSRLARCQCGAILSEWFTYKGTMYHPECIGGCGWISPWVDHTEWRAYLRQVALNPPARAKRRSE